VSLKKEILKTGVHGIEDKIQLTWNTVDIDKFSPLDNEDISDSMYTHSFKTEFNIPENKQIILFIGNINKRKNVSTLLNAKKHIKSDCVLVVVGNGPLLKSLKEKVKFEEIKNVVFTGARKDISRIIRNSDIFVLPSYKEGSGIVLLEALACGKPVIGSKIGGTKELITSDVGLLFEPTNSKELANAIDSILLNADLKKRFQIDARKLAMDYAEVDISYYRNLH
jgi:glycosyltransferase involved in cell wall biosynthesis